MKFTKKALLTQAIAAGVALFLIADVADAKTIRVGNQGDALSLDPHSLNDLVQLADNFMFFKWMSVK
jgi:peptide/nickel transport system substrate-binding protein